MAQSNGHTPQWKYDLEAFAPRPAGAVTLKDEKGKVREFAVWNVLDLKAGDSLRVLALEDSITEGGRSIQDIFAAGLEQVRLLAPDIPPGLLDALTPNQVLTIRRKALGYDAANPQPAGGVTTTETVPSATSSVSSPAPGASSDGP